MQASTGLQSSRRRGRPSSSTRKRSIRRRRLRQHSPRGRAEGRYRPVSARRDPSRSDHARDHPELAAGDQRRDVRRDPQDGDERDHLRGARHGHRHHGRRGQPRLVRRRDPGVRRRARQGGAGGSSSCNAATTFAPATSSSRTIRSTAASRTSTTSCSRCRSSPATTRRLDGEHRALERRRRHGARLDLERSARDLPGGPAPSRQ